MIAFFVPSGRAQNLVGMSSDQIFTFLKNKGISTDSIQTAKNSNGSTYLSYENSKNKFIYFLDSTMTCYCYRVVYPYSELNSTIKKLDEKFVHTGHFKWMDYEKETYEIKLEKLEGYFVTDVFLE
jgi:hypothetical protein